MLPGILKRLLTGGLWGLVMSLASLTAYGQVHVVHHEVHVVPHSVVDYGPCCTYYGSYAYHVYHSYHVYHPYHSYHVHHVYRSYPVHHVYHSYAVHHVYHSYPVVHHVYHEYQACCPHYESHDYTAHDRESGYHEGFDRGKDDAEDCRALDPYHSHHLRDSHSVAYRDGFVQGYEAGYHNYTH
jgi:hypothetical protein